MIRFGLRTLSWIAFLSAIAVLIGPTGIAATKRRPSTRNRTPVHSLKAVQSNQLPPGRVKCADVPASTFSMFVPLAHVRYFGAADIVLNSRSVESKTAVPTWYLEGRRVVVGDPIVMTPGVEFVPLQTLLPAGVTLSEVTGLSLSYTGHSRELWAQMTLRPGNSAEPAQSLDAVFTMDQDFKSTSLDAVWAVRHGPARTVIVLANTSDRPLLVQVAHPNAEREVTIAPQSVRLVNLASRASRAPWTGSICSPTAHPRHCGRQASSCLEPIGCRASSASLILPPGRGRAFSRPVSDLCT